MLDLIKRKKQSELQPAVAKKIKRKLRDIKTCSLPILAASSRHPTRFLVKKLVTYGNQNSYRDLGFSKNPINI